MKKACIIERMSRKDKLVLSPSKETPICSLPRSHPSPPPDQITVAGLSVMSEFVIIESDCSGAVGLNKRRTGI